MAQDWTTLGVTVAGAAVGALLPLIWSRGGSSGRSVDRTTVGGDLHQGDDRRRYKVRIDNRVINKVTAQVSIDARQLVPAAPAAAPSSRSGDGSGDDDEVWGKVVGLLLLIGLCVVGYLRYREVVTTVAVSVQLFALSVAAGALVVARLRSVVYSTGVTVQLLLNLVMGAGAVLSLRWLTDPPSAGSAGLLRELLVHGRSMGLVQLIDAYGLPGVAFLVYQLMGLVVSVLAMALVVLHSLKVYVAAGIAVRVTTDPAYRPGAARLGFLRFGGSATGCWAAAVGLSVMGLLLMSGLGYELFDHLQQRAAQPVVPAPAPPMPFPAATP